jgi:hypothetical protein
VRSLRNAAFAVLLSAAMLVAGASAALAAPAPSAGIEWTTYGGKTLGPGSEASICSRDGHVEGGQTLLIQVLRKGAWVSVHTFGADALKYGWWCVSVTPSKLVSKPGRYTFRAVTRSAASTPLSKAQITFTLVREKGYVQPEAPQELFTTTKAKNRTIPVSIFTAQGERVDLQRKSGSRWVNVSSARAPRTGKPATVHVTAPAKAGMGKYRIVNRGTTWFTTYVSPTFRMHQTDAVRYRSYITAARRYVARYCPKTPIYIDTPPVAGAGLYGVVGYSRWESGSWGGSSTLTTTIELRSRMPAAQLRSVALHECAHVLQARAHVTGRYSAEQRHAAKLYPGTGVEGQADCMSFYLTKNPRYFGYVRGCSRSQLTDAKRMWHAYGSKYQAAVYRWRT